MNMFRAFMELDEVYNDRQALIDKIKQTGRSYRFDKYTDAQLYRIWDRIKADLAMESDFEHDLAHIRGYSRCDNCNTILTDGGYCPVCDDGATDVLDEAIYPDGLALSAQKTSNWVKMPQSAVAPATSTAAQPQANLQPMQTSTHTHGTPYIVTIVYDHKAHKLRAVADDGTHGQANVAFPNNLRNAEGQQYRVGNLIWNGKNYRAVGNITPVNSVSNTQNINEQIDKENYFMNFQTVLEELNRLYEADEVAVVDEAEVVAEEPTEEVATAEESTQRVLECTKCGALVIKDESEVTIDEETDLANIEEECAFCGETEGYKVIGAFSPFNDESNDVNESLSESHLTEGKIKDSLKKLATRLGADAATCVRGIAELISDVTRNDTLYDIASHIEDKAVLKALMSGNERVLNTLTKDDIEELKQDIEDYKKSKGQPKDEELEEGIFNKKAKETRILSVSSEDQKDFEATFDEVTKKFGVEAKMGQKK